MPGQRNSPADMEAISCSSLTKTAILPSSSGGVGSGSASKAKAMDACELWLRMRQEAHDMAKKEPLMAGFMRTSVLDHCSLAKAVAFQLAHKLGTPTGVQPAQWEVVFSHALTEDPRIMRALREDLLAIAERDPACKMLLQPLLFFKGFQGLQAHRVAHWLWNKRKVGMAQLLQARVSEVYGMDIHPAARIGKGVMFDHAMGVVIGETAVIGDNCSFLHNVTLGGTGRERADRHPKLGAGVSVGASVYILGNIVIGDGAKIGAGSVVLKPVPPYMTAVGAPAKLVVPRPAAVAVAAAAAAAVAAAGTAASTAASADSRSMVASSSSGVVSISGRPRQPQQPPQWQPASRYHEQQEQQQVQQADAAGSTGGRPSGVQLYPLPQRMPTPKL